MDQEHHDGGAERTPDEFRHEIEETREHLGETVQALAEKADVKAQAKERIDDAKARLTSKPHEVREKIAGATPDSASQAASNATDTVKSRPIPFVAIAAFAAGIGIGILISRRG
jgi:ElaB/YqjD/DUF883 family membrane-anchored ribosome-binding protein